MTVQRPNGWVEFRLFAPRARQVHVVGDFNEWDTSSHPMRRTKQGTWVCRLRLGDGAYEYRYLIDGAWRDDPRPTDEPWTPACRTLLVAHEPLAPALHVG